jgi:hypothetical protein
MRRILLLMIPLLLIPSFFSATATTPQQTGDPLPNPADYTEAGAYCRRRVKVSPWVGTPGVDWPKTFQCVLVIHTCDGVKRFTSGVRPGGTGMCDDYWRVHNALADRVICCDQGSREEKRPPDGKGSPERKCEPRTSWFDDTSDCKEVKSPQLVIRQGTATLYMCGYSVFQYRDSNLNDQLFADAYRAAMRDQLLASSSSKVCCDKFRQAVRTRKPCDPRVDVDCDGTPNRTDIHDRTMPDIDTFIRPDNASIDPFPYRFDTSNPDFLPDRTARNSKGVGDCPCKWELVKGELKCSPDGKQKHYYKATWKCPKTGAEVSTVKYAPATAPCER